MFEFAPKTTSVTLASETPIENGSPIRVWGILFQSTTAGTNEIININSADGNTTYLSFRLIPNIFNEYRNLIPIPWIADKGLKFVAVSGDATVRITVFHSQAGS